MLPIDPNSVTPSGSGYTYTFQDPNSANIVYNFNGAQTTPTSGTISPGLGYFGTKYIAPPMYACDPMNKSNAFSAEFPNWLSTINANVDLRGFYVKCVGSTPSTYAYERIIPDQNEVLDTMSSYTGNPVAYTTEALYYAQSGYFVTVVMVQWSNVFACKSRKVTFCFILVFFDLFRHQQTYVRWCIVRNCFVHRLVVRSGYQRSLRW